MDSLPADFEFGRPPGSFVYSLDGGYGWIGFDDEECAFYFISERDDMFLFAHDKIFVFNDRWTGYLWIIFWQEDRDLLVPFVLNPDPDITPRAVDPKLREFLS